MSSQPVRDDDFEFWRHPRWWRAWLLAGFGPMFLIFVGVGIVSGMAVWFIKGEAVFWQALEEDLAMVIATLPRVVIAVAVAGILWALLPRERISAMIGRDFGLWGLVLATFGGMITPGGPSSAFVLLAMIGAMGADRGVMVTYISAWATLGLQRILTWDVPMMGLDFSALRFAATLALPIVAGLVARALPIRMELKREVRLRDRM